MWPSCRPAVCSRWCICWENWGKWAPDCSRERLIADSTQLTHPSKMSVTCHSIQRGQSFTENRFCCCGLTWGQQDTGVCLMFDWKQQPYWMFFMFPLSPELIFKMHSIPKTGNKHHTSDSREKERRDPLGMTNSRGHRCLLGGSGCGLLWSACWPRPGTDLTKLSELRWIFGRRKGKTKWEGMGKVKTRNSNECRWKDKDPVSRSLSISSEMFVENMSKWKV